MIRRCASAAFVTGVLAAGLASPAAAAPVSAAGESAAAEVRLEYVIIRNDHSQKDITIRGASPAPGADAIQWRYEKNNNLNDVMVLEVIGNAIRIKPWHMFTNDGNPHNDQCLAVHGASIAPGAKVIQHTCTYDTVDNDVWTQVINIPGGGLGYRNNKSGLCLVVRGASTLNGAQLIQHECTGTAPTNDIWQKLSYWDYG